MKNVLIIDDSATMRLFMKMFLKGLHGVRITEAMDGLDGLEKIGRERFDLIITDVNMPRLDGLGLIEELRGKRKLNVPIVILSTRGEEKHVERGISLGANSYITKPISGTMLANVVTRYVGIS
jgi:two-component system chemotaxis response regulator CheY